MKSNKLNLVILSVLMITIGVTPASVLAQDQVDENDIVDMVERNVVPTIKKTEISGTPYVTDDFTSGSFEVYSGRYANAEYMNFNIYEERLEYRSGNQTYGVDLANIRQFKLSVDGTERLYKRGYDSRRLDGDEFVEVAAEGPLTFLIKYEVNFNENASSGYGSATKQASFSKNERYYFKEGDKVSNVRRLNERRVMRYFEGSNTIETFIDQNNLDLSNPRDVAKAVAKFNELNM